MRVLVCLPLALIGLLTACMHVTSAPQPVPAQVPPSAPPPATFVPTPPAPSTPEQATLPSESAKPQPVPPPPPAKPGATPAAPKPSNAVSDKGKVSGSAALKPPPPAAALAPAPPAGAIPSKPQLDFKAMEQRLRDTSAIGVFTKLSIKNQVDDLLKAFRGYHAGHIPPSLDELHQRYDGLLLKVVTLVQNDDATLASSISASRGAIWERLSNKESFQKI